MHHQTCCRNRFPYTESEIWQKLRQNLQILQENLHLATLLENLSRKGQIGELVVTELLSLEKGEAILKLINLLMSQNPSSSRDMCDALQETHPDISDKVGLGPLPAADDCHNPAEHSHVVKSYHAVLTVSTEPHKHKEENQLHHSQSKHSAFM
ncbi:uncharacterized protein LOC111123033 isoform X2 [Crassostrea virginica]